MRLFGGESRNHHEKILFNGFQFRGGLEMLDLCWWVMRTEPDGVDGRTFELQEREDCGSGIVGRIREDESGFVSVCKGSKVRCERRMDTPPRSIIPNNRIRRPFRAKIQCIDKSDRLC